MTLRVSWLAMAVVLGIALTYGAVDEGRPSSLEDEVQAIATTIGCPTCGGQSVGESDAPASQAIRAEIERRLNGGASAAEIRGYFGSRYGEQILLTPSGSGVTGLVWALPVAAAILAGSAIGWAFLRWRRWAS